MGIEFPGIMFFNCNKIISIALVINLNMKFCPNLNLKCLLKNMNVCKYIFLNVDFSANYL